MSHVHWLLFGLSFVTGLVLTLALAVRPVKRQAPVGAPADGLGAAADIEREPPTTRIPAPYEFFARDFAADDQPRPTTIPVEQESPTSVMPIEQDHPAAEIPVEEEAPASEIPAAGESPAAEIPVEQGHPAPEIPVEEEAPATEIPAAEEPAATPEAKQPPKIRFSFIRRFLAKRAAAEKKPKAKRPAAKKTPPKKARPAVKGAPSKRVPGTKKAPPKKVPPGKRIPPGKRAPGGMGRPVKKAPAVKQSPPKPPGATESPTTWTPVLPYEPYGPGSARATPDGGGPAGWQVKGRSDTRLYYTPDDETYEPTVAQVWFKDEASAARACFTPWRRSSRK